MTVVYYTLTDSSGRALQHQLVTFTLQAPGNPFADGDVAVVEPRTVDTGVTGRFEVDLIPTEDYEAIGAWYLVDARNGNRNPDARWAIHVPATGGPLDMRSLVFPEPEPGEPTPPVPAHALGDHTDVDTTGEFAGQVLKFDGTKWRPGADNTGGGSGGGSGYTHFQDIAANVTTVLHSLGYRPGGIRLFSADWATEVDEFAVHHLSDDAFEVQTGLLFRGYVTAS